ncbi:unnamed protein product [Hydatigera taeniaeformis]|uniref:Uncharacterized protein n=1 Tax=Hydatigena taeniaeformis TaxID=6205 RepID=A0A0R3X1E3_HYDTA|nr:unnamed protein product [Hydatigera taeniaeformis]
MMDALIASSERRGRGNIDVMNSGGNKCLIVNAAAFTQPLVRRQRCYVGWCGGAGVLERVSLFSHLLSLKEEFSAMSLRVNPVVAQRAW